MEPKELSKLNALQEVMKKQLKIVDDLVRPISEPYNRLQKIIQETLKPFEELSELLKYHIYVDPVTFKALTDIFETQKIVPISKVKIDKKFPSYYIYTNGVKAPEYEGQEIIVNEESALLISNLDRAYRHKFYANISKVPFNKHSSILSIEEHHFKITKDSDIFNLCLMLFGSKQYIMKIWKWKDIKDRVLGYAAEQEDEEGAFKLKVYRLNLRLDKTGYKNMILYKNKTVRVNPQYYFLFK